LDVDFGSAEVFTRAFRARFGMTPTDWRRGAWRDWAGAHQQQLRKIHQAERNAHQAIAQAFRQDADRWPMGPVDTEGAKAMDVELKNLPPMRVAYLRHVGPYGTAGIPRLWQRFAAWCESRGPLQPRCTMVGISHDQP
jgi:AraC family transcriptional regulator